MSSQIERLKFPLFEGDVIAVERTFIMKKRKNLWQKLKEVLAELVKEDLEYMENGENEFKGLEERMKSQRRKKPKT
jgi:hypothetical protein